MLLDLACLFSSAPIIECGRIAPRPAQTMAVSWHVLISFLPASMMCGYAYLKTIYPRRIDWSRDEPDWDVGTSERPTIEIRARRAGE